MNETLRRDWLNPTVIVAVLGILGTAYAGFMVQRQRIEHLEYRLEQLEHSYQELNARLLDLQLQRK